MSKGRREVSEVLRVFAAILLFDIAVIWLASVYSELFLLLAAVPLAIAVYIGEIK